MFIAGWTAIALEIVLLLVWVYHIFFSANKTDPAGEGMAMFFLIALGLYIGAGVVLMMLKKNWSMTLALVMALIPLAVVVYGLLKHYGSRPN
jgi:hypothetical protein